MQVEKNKVVGIDYKLTDGSGKLIDSSANHGPLYYIQGIGSLIPGLETALEGKKQEMLFKLKLHQKTLTVNATMLFAKKYLVLNSNQAKV